ncbi:MAG: SOS response-associated peptidase family protein [Microbacterium sp.]
MCASYGLDPRFADGEYGDIIDTGVLDGLRAWAAGNDGEILRPTGKNRRNLNPLITTPSTLELSWWGYLINGAPASFASINTRSERVAASRSSLPARAIVPVSFWREMQKPSRIWHHFTAPDDALLGLAAFTRPGRTADGAEYTCYSIVTQPAARHLEHVHDRMPLLINPGFAEEWLMAQSPGSALIDAAIAAAQPVSELVQMSAMGNEKPTRRPELLF